MQAQRIELLLDEGPIGEDAAYALLDAWASLYDQAFALDQVRVFHEDWYRFDLTARSRVSIAVQEARGELGGATRTWLYDGQFRPLYVLDNPAPGSDEGRTVHDLDAGPYFVRIIALSEQVIFQYRMSFGAEPLA